MSAVTAAAVRVFGRCIASGREVIEVLPVLPVLLVCIDKDPKLRSELRALLASLVGTKLRSDPKFSAAKLLALAIPLAFAAFRRPICSTKGIPEYGFSLGAVKPDATVQGKLALESDPPKEPMLILWIDSGFEG
jgi:hypothetical protein